MAAPWVPGRSQLGKRIEKSGQVLGAGSEGQGLDLLPWLKVFLRRSAARILVREGGKERVKGNRGHKKGGFHKGKLLILSVINHA